MSNNIRRVPLAEKELIVDFLNENWGSKHPLVNNAIAAISIIQRIRAIDFLSCFIIFLVSFLFDFVPK